MTTTSKNTSGGGGAGRAVLVSGASTGIGRATAIALAASGWTVFAGVRDLTTAPTASTASTAACPGVIVPVKLDVTSPASIAQAIRSVAADLGQAPLSALVNNAGVGLLAPMRAVALADLRSVLEVNVVGAVALAQAALPLMAPGGRLVFLGSVGDRLTMPYGGPLTSSKWALASIAEAFRLELNADGIDVVLIEPGSIHTPAVDKVETSAAQTVASITSSDPELARRFASAAAVAVANERQGSKPEVVAATILYALTSRRSRTRYLTGRHARLLATLAAVLPDRAFDRLRLQLFHQSATHPAAGQQERP
ncbi:MAG: SDR family NAD(P)-dependent oxidoreductase [Lapillicoccus sp.]